MGSRRGAEEVQEEALVTAQLQELQKQLGKKHSFETAVSAILSLLRARYTSSSPALRKSIYSAVCRVATVLRSRYTAPGFWLAGLGLFEEAERLVTEKSEKEHLNTCISGAREQLRDVENPQQVAGRNERDSRYLFEGHLTVGPEPPPPAWLVAQNVLTTLAASQDWNAIAESSRGQGFDNNRTDETSGVPEFVQQLINNVPELNFQDLENVIEASLQEIGAGPQRPPPASKEVVANLPVVEVTDEVIARLGSDTECAVCRENLVVGDKMQEMPCNHLFHPPCLKPWLDEHNSCPICRHELRTDDHEYESRKEREKEAEEDRKGAENAIRGGEYMYV